MERRVGPPLSPAVPAQDTNAATCFQELPLLGDPTEDSVRKCSGGDWEGKAGFRSGIFCRCEEQPGGWTSSPLSLMTSVEEYRSWGRLSFVIPWCAPIFFCQAWAEGKGEFATSRLRTDQGRGRLQTRTGQCAYLHDLYRSRAIND